MSAATAATPNLAERLAKVCVGLRPELEVSRHVFRRSPAYILRDPITFQTHHLNETDYRIVSALTPERSLKKVFEQLVEGRVLDADDQEGFYRFIVGLNQRGLLSLPVSDGQQLYARYERRKALERHGGPLRYLFHRVPLLRPDDFLNRTMKWFQPLFTRTAFVVWIVAAIASLVVLSIRWRAFCDPLGSMLALQSLPLLWVLLVGLKVAHEFGHAYACKHFGGRVPEMGAYFVLLTPCAYVDASAAWGFPKRSERIIVSLAGMYVESILAMIALVIWCVTEPSLLNSAAQYAIVLSTVVTVGFNINPLMKYDGYFVLTDLLEIPNLAQQAKAETSGWLGRIAMGVPYQSPYRRSTRLGLIAYHLASSAYRVLVTLGICTMFALTVPVLGVGLALFYAFTAIRDAVKHFREFAVRFAETQPRRGRALAMVFGAGLIAPTLVLLVPIPWSRHALGVVAQEDDRVLRAESNGFVQRLNVSEGEKVAQGAMIATLENAELLAAWQTQRAECDRLKCQLQGGLQQSHADAEAIAARLAQAERECTDIARRKEGLVLRAPEAGEVMHLAPLEDVGRYVRVGEPLAEIGSGRWVVRTLLNADGYASAQPKVGQPVEARLSGASSELLQGSVLHVAVAGDRRVDDAALTHLGGGEIAVHADTMEAGESLYEVTIVLDAPASTLRHGMTAQVKFPPRTEALGVRIYHGALRFLNRLRAAV